MKLYSLKRYSNTKFLLKYQISIVKKHVLIGIRYRYSLRFLGKYSVSDYKTINISS